MLPVYINSAQYKIRYCTTRYGRRRTCDKYHELKAIHREESHQYTLRMMGPFSRVRTEELVERNVNVWVDENNHWLVYQAAVVGKPNHKPMFSPHQAITPKQFQDLIFYRATMPDKANSERLVLSYEDTLKQLQEKAEEEAKYYPLLWILALFLTVLGSHFLWLSYRWWREDSRF